MKHIITLMAFAGLVAGPALFVNGQVQGVCASKLGAFTAWPVPSRELEFEPAFSVTASSRGFDENRHRSAVFENNDTTTLSLASGLRFTYGISPRIEAGCLLSMDLTTLSFATKILLLSAEKAGVSALLGLNLQGIGEPQPLGSGDYGQSPLLAAGFAYTLQGNDKFSLDANIQGQKALTETTEEHVYDLFLTVDAGYYFRPGLQAVTEVYYSSSRFGDDSLYSDILILNLGLTIETAENYILVLNSPLPLLGKNAAVEYGFGMALTILLR